MMYPTVQMTSAFVRGADVVARLTDRETGRTGNENTVPTRLPGEVRRHDGPDWEV